MIRYVKSLVVAGVIGGVSVLAGTVQADIIPTLDRVETEDGNFRWVYTANLTVDQRIENGDFFTIYDFRGFLGVGTMQQPDGWEPVSQNIGVTPDRVLPDDDAGIPNLTWMRTGGTIGDGSTTVALGEFSAVSTLREVAFDNFTSRATRAVGMPEGTKIDNVGMVAVPIPLPGALVMFPMGAVVAGLAYRRLRRQGL